jgi:nitroreductase
LGFANAYLNILPRSTGRRTTAHSLTIVHQSPQKVGDSNVDFGAVDVNVRQEIDLPADNKPTSASVTNNISIEEAFGKVINARYACTRFQRYQEPTPTNATAGPTASISNAQTIISAYDCLSLSQRSPTGFNVQPFRVVLVHGNEQKSALSQYCLGRNADRVRDSDCTAVFLSDAECGRDWSRFRDFLLGNMDDDSKGMEGDDATTKSTSRARRTLSKDALNKMRILILLFSSGYPLPRILASPFSFVVRLGVAIFASVTRMLHVIQQKLSRSSAVVSKVISKLLPRNSLILPTLSSSETWSQKNTMLVAMSYMLACTSQGLATCPMEGFDAQGIRSVLGIPRRFGIPLIVSTGTKYRGDEEGVDDVGVSHGDGGMSPRYPMEEVVFGNVFGEALVCPA